jgi:uncharacterized membrane protein YphA (DoxX/SURF4 family)
MSTSDWLYKSGRWVLGAVFIYAGSIKLLEPKTFAVLIDAYGIVPEGLLMPVSILLPALEVAAGIGLLFDIEGSLSVIAALLCLFIAILGYGIWMGLDVDCGCFGPQDPEAKAFHGLRQSLYRDLVMLAGIVTESRQVGIADLIPPTAGRNEIFSRTRGISPCATC